MDGHTSGRILFERRATSGHQSVETQIKTHIMPTQGELPVGTTRTYVDVEIWSDHLREVT